MAILNILHLIGSATSDFYSDLSCLYASDCLENADDPSQYRFHIAYVSPDRTWRFPTSLNKATIDKSPALSLSEAIDVIVKLSIDVVIPQMFCIPGMTQYRALFDLLNIPYVGNTADVMALVADKAKTKAIVASAGVDVPIGQVLSKGDRPNLQGLEFPIVIKPMNGDNSIGVTLVNHPTDFDSALNHAFDHSDTILIEKFIELGREVRCGIVVRSGELVCLPLEEYALNSETKPIRSYVDKLNQTSDGSLGFAAKDNTQSWIVDPSDPITAKVWEIAKQCHTALGCRHYSLFDFRIDPDGNPWFLEAGLFCSFSRKSVISSMSKASGTGLHELFQMMLETAIVAEV